MAADPFTAYVYYEYNTFDGCLIPAACYGVKKEGTDEIIGSFFVLCCLLGVRGDVRSRADDDGVSLGNAGHDLDVLSVRDTDLNGHLGLLIIG